MNSGIPGKRTPHKGATPHRTNLEKLTFINSTRQYGPSPHVPETHTVQVKTSPLPTIYFSSTALAHKAKQSKSLASSLVHKLTNICTRTYQIYSINPSHQPTLAPCHRYSYIHDPPSRPLTAIYLSILFLPSRPPTSLLQTLIYVHLHPHPQSPKIPYSKVPIPSSPSPPPANILLLLLLVRYDTSRVSSTRANTNTNTKYLCIWSTVWILPFLTLYHIIL